MKKIVETERLQLRCFEKQDLSAYHEVMGQPEVSFPKGDGKTGLCFYQKYHPLIYPMSFMNWKKKIGSN